MVEVKRVAVAADVAVQAPESEKKQEVLQPADAKVQDVAQEVIKDAKADKPVKPNCCKRFFTQLKNILEKVFCCFCRCVKKKEPPKPKAPVEPEPIGPDVDGKEQPKKAGENQKEPVKPPIAKTPEEWKKVAEEWTDLTVKEHVLNCDKVITQKFFDETLNKPEFQKDPKAFVAQMKKDRGNTEELKPTDWALDFLCKQFDVEAEEIEKEAIKAVEQPQPGLERLGNNRDKEVSELEKKVAEQRKLFEKEEQKQAEQNAASKEGNKPLEQPKATVPPRKENVEQKEENKPAPEQKKNEADKKEEVKKPEENPPVKNAEIQAEEIAAKTSPAAPPVKAPQVPVKGPQAPVKAPQAPVKGPQVPVKAPQGPVKGPQAPVKGPQVPVKGQQQPIPQPPVKGQQPPVPQPPVKGQQQPVPQPPVKGKRPPAKKAAKNVPIGPPLPRGNKLNLKSLHKEQKLLVLMPLRTK